MRPKQLLSSLYGLKHIHEDVSTLRHATFLNNNWEVFVPTHFMYVFVFFNTLYDIDWKESLGKGKVWYLGPGNSSEKTKIKNFADFILQNEYFVDDYFGDFLDMILPSPEFDGEPRATRAQRLKLDLEGIEELSVSGRRITKKVDIEKFQKNISLLVDDHTLDKRLLFELLEFIYHVRCNMFHGSKSFEDIQKRGQKNRLAIYADILTATNQMLFSYIQYLSESHS